MSAGVAPGRCARRHTPRPRGRRCGRARAGAGCSAAAGWGQGKTRGRSDRRFEARAARRGRGGRCGRSPVSSSRGRGAGGAGGAGWRLGCGAPGAPGRRRGVRAAAAPSAAAGRAGPSVSDSGTEGALRGCGQRAGTTPLYQVGNSRCAPLPLTQRRPAPHDYAAESGGGAWAARAHWSAAACGPAP